MGLPLKKYLIMKTVIKNQLSRVNINVKVFTLIFSFLFVLTSFSQIPSYLSPNALVGYWPFNGNANDLSGNGNNGVLNGVTLTKDREGNPNSAYHFNNKTDLITIPSTFYTPLDTNFTISFWIKSNCFTRMDVFNLNDSGQYQANFNMVLNDKYGNTSNGIISFWNSGGTNSIAEGLCADYIDNLWHNFLIIRNSGAIEIFVDGVQSSNSVNYASVIGLNNSITISSILYPFYGDIDDLIIYERAVSSAEINNIVKNSNATPYIISPATTDSYSINDTVKIKWVKAIGYDTVNIKYSLNNGINWQVVANNINVNAQSYIWNAPNMPGGECLIKIVDINNPSKFSVSDKFLINKYQWQLVNDTNSFSVRDGVQGYAFNNKMYLMGGWNPLDPINYPNITTNEVWESTDGNSWNLLDTADWEGRHCFGSIIHNGKMWVIGGDQLQGHYQKDIWNTSDGINWTKICDSVPWGDRMTHMTCSFDGKIWVMGGQKIVGWGNYIDTVYNDVWNSVDGITWNLVTDSAAWNPRGQINKVCVFNNKMWIVGGGTYNGQRKYYNDVWNSTDGINWTLVTHIAPWKARQFQDLIVYDNAMWIIGGYSEFTNNMNDVWYTEDGITWHELKNTPWPPRHACAVLNHNQSLWVVAGNMWNDSWRLNTIICPNVISPVATTTVLSGNTAILLANYSSPSATYTWQVKNGQLWQGVSNSVFINGSNNDTLKLNNVSIANSGEEYRCIVESGACSDTTYSSVLTVLLPTGIKENIKESSLVVYPNPANDFILITITENLINLNYTLVDQLGRTVLEGKLSETMNNINIEKLSSGYYILNIDDRKDLSLKVIKI